jgi:hypothetical protein
MLRTGTVAVCYCEAWPGDGPDPCAIVANWVLIGKFQVQGPKGNQGWILDTGMIQSFTLEGFRFEPHNVVRILEEGKFCEDESIDKVMHSIKWCPPALLLAGRCAWHGPVLSTTFTVTRQALGFALLRINHFNR